MGPHSTFVPWVLQESSPWLQRPRLSLMTRKPEVISSWMSQERSMWSRADSRSGAPEWTRGNSHPHRDAARENTTKRSQNNEPERSVRGWLKQLCRTNHSNLTPSLCLGQRDLQRGVDDLDMTLCAPRDLLQRSAHLKRLIVKDVQTPSFKTNLCYCFRERCVTPDIRERHNRAQSISDKCPRPPAQKIGLTMSVQQS